MAKKKSKKKDMFKCEACGKVHNKTPKMKKKISNGDNIMFTCECMHNTRFTGKKGK